MDTTVPQQRTPVSKYLPWLLALPFLALYLITRHPWYSVTSLAVTGDMGGLDGSWLYQKPGFALVTGFVRWLPVSVLPKVANTLAAFMGAGVLVLLGRCAYLLPRDRTREERIRSSGGEAEALGRWIWFPPILAVSLLGLQRTFWEHATAQTGELWDLLAFAWCIRCLLEYRADRQDKWFWRFSVVYGFAAVDNWAMYSFAPLFAVAILWMRGKEVFDFPFLVRLVGLGMIGFLLYLVAPMIGRIQAGSSISWGEAIHAQLVYQRSVLFGIPRGRILLLALVNLLPLVMLGIRWEGSSRTPIERITTIMAVVMFHLAGLILGLITAFDLRFGPRQMVYLDPLAGGVSVPLLTFHYCSALATAYFAGYFILVGGFRPSRNWSNPGPVAAFLGRLGWAVCLLLAVGTPFAMVARNWSAVRSENQPYLQHLASGLREKLPAEGSVVLSSDYLMHELLLATEPIGSVSKPNLYILTPKMPEVIYRRHLADSAAAKAWPELRRVADARTNIANEFLSLWYRAVREDHAFLTYIGADFLSEGVRQEPLALSVRARVASSEGTSGLVIRPDQVAEVVADWDQRREAYRELNSERAPDSMTAQVASQLLSRTANSVGAALQAAKDYSAARHLFEVAKEWDANNVSADVNLLANSDLSAGRSVGPTARRRMEGYSPSALYVRSGSIEEPEALLSIGRELMLSDPPCMQSATGLFLRAKELDPSLTRASLAIIAVWLNRGFPQKALAEIASIEHRPDLKTDERLSIVRFRSGILTQLGRTDEVESTLEEAVEKLPNQIAPLDLLSSFYLEHRRLSKLAPVLGAWEHLDPTDSRPVLRRAMGLMLESKYLDAVPLLDTLLSRNPELETARANRAMANLQLKKFDLAKRDFDRLLERAPNNYVYHAGAAQVSEQEHDEAGALSHWDAFLATAPHEAPQYTNVLEKVRQLRKKG